LILGLVALDEEPAFGYRVIAVALVAGAIWSLILFG
jgi:hypothetical protein